VRSDLFAALIGCRCVIMKFLQISLLPGGRIAHASSSVGCVVSPCGARSRHYEPTSRNGGSDEYPRVTMSTVIAVFASSAARDSRKSKLGAVESIAQAEGGPMRIGCDFKLVAGDDTEARMIRRSRIAIKLAISFAFLVSIVFGLVGWDFRAWPYQCRFGGDC